MIYYVHLVNLRGNLTTLERCWEGTYTARNLVSVSLCMRCGSSFDNFTPLSNKSSFESRQKTTLFSVAYSLLMSPPFPPLGSSSVLVPCWLVFGVLKRHDIVSRKQTSFCLLLPHWLLGFGAKFESLCSDWLSVLAGKWFSNCCAVIGH